MFLGRRKERGRKGGRERVNRQSYERGKERSDDEEKWNAEKEDEIRERGGAG